VAGDSEETWQIADRLYAARTGMAGTKPGKQGVGIAELLQFLADPASTLSMEAQRALFSNPRLRADFHKLKQRLRMGELPARAAASDSNLNMRTFEGGTVRIHPSRVAGQTYALFQFNWPSGLPRALLIEGAAGEIIKRPLSAADASGQVVIILDQASAADQAFLRLICDPMATGSFLL